MTTHDCLTSAKLEAYLTDYGWTFDAVGEGEWATGFAGDQRTYPLHIRLTGTCVSFEVRPFIELDEDGRAASRLARELLELNDRLALVKIGLSEAGEVSLSCQALLAGFDFDALSQVLGVLGYYADELTLELAGKLERARERPLLS